MDSQDSGELRGIYDEHAAALWQYALLLSGNRARAADVVKETMRHARRDPEVADAPSRALRAWLFTLAHTLVIDDQRSPGFSNEIGAADSVWPDRAAPE